MLVTDNVFTTSACNRVSDISTSTNIVTPWLDKSLISLLRAFEGTRINEKFIAYCFHLANLNEDHVSNIRYFIRDNMRKKLSSLFIVNANKISMTDEDILAQIDTGFERNTEVEQYLKSKFNLKLMAAVSKESRVTLVITNRMTTDKLHALESSLNRLLPWCFDSPLSEKEKEIFLSLFEDTDEKFRELISGVYNANYYRGKIIDSYKKQFDETFYKYREERCRDRVDRILDDIHNCQRRMKDLLRVKADADSSLLAAKLSKDSFDELFEYIKSNNKIEIVSVSDDFIRFEVFSNLECFDESMADTIISNEKSYTHYRYDGDHDIGKFNELMKRIFVTQDFTIRTCAAFTLNLDDYDLDANSRTCDYWREGYIPNPHLTYYNCLGDNYQYINAAALEHDSIGIVSQCVAATANLNFGDSTVMERFCEWLIHTRIKCICLPNGEYVDYKGAIEYIDNESKNNETTNKEVENEQANQD